MTPLAVLVLGLLREADMHPYEMLRLLRHRRADLGVRITNGTLYHTVGRLLREGLLEEVGVDREGSRPERTTYSLVAAGNDALTGAVQSWLGCTDRSTEFRVALAEAHNLPREQVAELMRARHAALTAEYETLHSALEGARTRAVAEQFLVEADRHEVLLAAELAWTEGLLARLARPEFPWGVDDLRPQDIARYQELRKAARE